MSRMSRKHIPASMANLRPQPGNGHGRGFGSGAHVTCSATRRDGQPCRAVAAYGTRVCRVHGANAKGVPGSRPDVREAYALLTREPVPVDLTREPAWQAARGVTHKARLLMAWMAAQQGDWGPWRNLQTT